MSRSILAVLFGVILSISSLSAAPATGPSGEDPNGLFATYFQNMENNPCSLANSFITGFDSTIGVTYMTPLCTSFNGSNYFSLSGNIIGPTQFLGSTNNQDLIIRTNNTEKMRVAVGGNVGIGTATPTAKLHIQNVLPGAQSDKTLFSIYDLYNAGSNGQYMNVIGGNSGVNLIANWLPLSFGARADGVAAMRQDLTITTGGNVGIGTTAPSVKMVVSSTQDNPLMLIKTAGTEWNYISFYTGTTRTHWLGADNNSSFALGTDGTSRDFYWWNVKNVGIGTTTPGYKLDVQDNVNNFLVSRLYNTNAGNNAQSISQLATGIPNTWANSLVHNNAGTPFYHLTTGTGIRNAYFSMPNYNFRNQTGSTLMAITATGYVGINTAPDTRVRFKVGGNVNIGTIPQPANPEWYDLQVGSVGVTTLYSYDSLCTGSSIGNCQGAGGAVIGRNNTGASVNFANNGNGFLMGNLGVGTNNPTSKLDVAGNMNISGTSTFGSSATLSGNMNISGSLCLSGICQSSWGGASLSQWGNTGSGIAYTGGNVGIGTVNPQAKLDVDGAIYVKGKGGLNYYNQAGYDQIELGSPAGSNIDVSFFTNSVSRMWIKPSGNVGIGTANPDGALEVAGSHLTLGQAGGAYSYIKMRDDESTNGVKYIHANTNRIGYVGGNGGWLSFWDQNGSWFDASGQQRIDGNGGWMRTYGDSGWYNGTYCGGFYMADPTWIRSYCGKYFYVDSIIQAGAYMNSPAYYYISDARLKKDLTKIDSPLEKIMKLNGYNFTWKKDGKKDMGLIAQEVEKVFPNLVGEYKDPDSKETYKNVEYGHMIAPLIEAIKEQQSQIEELKREVEALKK